MKRKDGKTSRTMLTAGGALLTQGSVLLAYLSEILTAEQAAIAASVLGLIQALLQGYMRTQTVQPLAKAAKVALTLLVALSLASCSAATCERVKMSKVDLPELGPKAAKVTYKCGKSTMSHTIKELPPCLRACWAEPDGR